MSDEDVDAMLFDPKYASVRNKPIFRIFVYAIALCSVLIFVRCIYRLIELAEGWTGYLILREAYFLVLEALIVFIGTFVLSVIHPGFVFGRNANIPVKGLGKKKKVVDIEEEGQRITKMLTSAMNYLLMLKNWRLHNALKSLIHFLQKKSTQIFWFYHDTSILRRSES